MAVVIESPMTPEQLENNYEYKVAKRALMREYPWIKDVTFKPSELEKYNLIFLDLIVDPIKMGEYYGYEFNPWIMGKLNRGEYYTGNFPSLIYDIPFERANSEVSKPIDNTLRQIHNSPALPEDMRLPKSRSLQVGAYIFNPDGPEW
jgi:hypothetical protein